MTTPGPVPEAPKQRRCVRVALAALSRVQGQRERFASDYGKATNAQERFAATSNALRAAAAEGAHQPDPDGVARRLDRINDAMTALLTELHEAQQDKAERTIRADKRRIERNERRRGYDGRSQAHTGPTTPDPPTASDSAA